MRKVLILIAVLALTIGIASVSMARVEGTPHDVAITSGDSTLEPCAMCHTPHSGSGAYPLWNRTGGAVAYTMYDSPTFDMPLTTGDLQAPSTNCMVCHNGTLSQLVNYPGPRSTADTDYDIDSTNLTAVWTDLGSAMEDDHPVSFTYNPDLDTATDNNGFPPAITPDGVRYFVGTGVANFPLYGTTGQEFECSTCHSVHHTVSGYGEAMTPACTGAGCSSGTQVHFLRASNAGSDMCQACHTLR